MRTLTSLLDFSQSALFYDLSMEHIKVIDHCTLFQNEHSWKFLNFLWKSYIMPQVTNYLNTIWWYRQSSGDSGKKISHERWRRLISFSCE
jgi:hypothetical protein